MKSSFLPTSRRKIFLSNDNRTHDSVLDHFDDDIIFNELSCTLTNASRLSVPATKRKKWQSLGVHGCIGTS